MGDSERKSRNELWSESAGLKAELMQLKVTVLERQGLIDQQREIHYLMVQERDQLKAQSERLREFIKTNNFDEPGAPGQAAVYVAELLKETSSQSLATIKAALLRKWAVRIFREAYPDYEDAMGEGAYIAATNISRTLHGAADGLEQEAGL